eukprot:2529892-Rhodomonas_salina.1
MPAKMPPDVLGIQHQVRRLHVAGARECNGPPGLDERLQKMVTSHLTSGGSKDMYHVLTMTRETQTQPQRCADAEIACVLFREEDIKKRDTGLLKGDLNPTRGKPVPVGAYSVGRAAVRKKGFAEMIPSGVKGPKDEERERAKKGEEGGERIKPKTYQDYNQWDKFVHKNLDQMLTDFDETDRQEQEEKHRLKLAEERKALGRVGEQKGGGVAGSRIEAKEEAVRQAGLRAEALKEAGNELLRQGDAEGAARKYEESIGAMPHNPIAHANKAQVRKSARPCSPLLCASALRCCA